MTLFRLSVSHWHVTRIVFLFAGSVTLVSVLAAYYLALPLLLVLPVFAGGMQIFFAVTGYCPLAILLAHLGVAER